ncbi:MAG: YggS family pyridoxal phosphate-dependent enzyme [Clostridia bacterium]|nr:YggS family pyridoxal phosphate-dependent enzyme [Clostridia bacterium]
MDNRFNYIDENFHSITERMRLCSSEVDKTTPCILLAAVKSADTEEINYLHRVHKVNDIGENRVQQLLSRYGEIEDRENLRIHFIGTLQRNKVKYIVDKVDMIHSVDSAELAAEISKRCKKASVVMDILIEVNIGREESKSGLMPEQVATVAAYADTLECIRVRGFMTMAPNCETEAEYRSYFSQMRKLSEHIWTEVLKKDGSPILSMGMSQSFEPAILEGSDIVRIGRQLFAK